MNNTNFFVLVGNVTKNVDDADFGYLPSGAARLNFSIAVNRSKKQGEEWINEASFFNITYFGKPAESLKNLIGKGSKVCVTGFMKQDRWEKDGQKFSKVSLIANQVELCGNKPDGENSGTSAQNSKPANNTPVNSNQGNGNPETSEGFSEDIPF